MYGWIMHDVVIQNGLKVSWSTETRHGIHREIFTFYFLLIANEHSLVLEYQLGVTVQRVLKLTTCCTAGMVITGRVN